MAENHSKSERVPCFAITAAVVLCIASVAGIVLSLVVIRSKPEATQRDVLVDCLPGKENTKKSCETRGCIWSDAGEVHVRPRCAYPTESQSVGYLLKEVVNATDTGMVFVLKRIKSVTLFGTDVDEVAVLVECQANRRLRIKIYDPDEARFEVPTLNIRHNKNLCNSTMYTVNYTADPHFGIQIIRKTTGTVIFNTSLPGMTFSDQFLQLTTRIPSSHVYGFGEHNHRRFKHDMNWKKWTIFAAGDEPVDPWNLYGVQPFYMNVENDGKANGVFLKNSNAMDVILQPEPFPAVSYRVIGGILDFYIFLGPTPESIVQQYTEAIGRPMMPPYWSLGFQLSRWDYGNLSNVKDVVNRNIDAGIPLDVMYGDIDYMYNKLDFTYDRNKFGGLPEFIDQLHNNSMKYIIILDPGIGTNPDTSTSATPGGKYLPLTVGLEKNVFLKDPREGSHGYQGYMHSKVWPGTVVFPDFSHPNATDYWLEFAHDLYHNQSLEFDGLWIDMNEPKGFVNGSTTGCDDNKYNYPPYLPNIKGGKMYYKTVCMDASSTWGSHYNTHSLYGHSMSIVTYNTLLQMFPRKRPFVLTRSNFAGSGKYAGHWLGDNQSQWRQLPWSIPGMLEFGLFGFPFIGADICGFWYDTNEELCTRWMLLGAFYPFSRNHNARGYEGQRNFVDQDPAAFGEKMIRASRDILHTRYRLLPFLYTLFHHAHTSGTTVARPLLHEFTNDEKTWDIDRQFLWGPSLLISPALEKGQTLVEAYFPKARWYDYFNSGKELSPSGKFHTLDTPVDKINVHIRGGYIIPWQESDVTTAQSRLKPLGVIVALDESHTAAGDIFWDDGESLETFANGSYLAVHFAFSVDTLTFTVVHDGYPTASSLVWNTMHVWGIKGQPTRVLSDGSPVDDSHVMYNPQFKTFTLRSLNLAITSNHTISWGY